MKKWFKTNVLYILGGFIGAIAGYVYYHQVGCASGTCMITSKPVTSTLYGALMGALLFGMLKREHKKLPAEEKDNSA